MTLIEKILMKKILMKKIRYKNIFRIFLDLGPKHSIPVNTRIFFQALQVPSWNIRKMFWRNTTNFFRVVFFVLGVLQVPFWNIRNFFKLRGRQFHFLKYKKIFFLRKYNNLFNLGIRKFNFPKYKKIFFWENIRKFLQRIFFIFWALPEKWPR